MMIPETWRRRALVSAYTLTVAAILTAAAWIGHLTTLAIMGGVL